MRRLILILSILVISALVYFTFNSGSGRKLPAYAEQKTSARERLIRDLYRHGAILVYPASVPSYPALYRRRVNDFQIFFRRTKVKIIPDTSVTRKELKDNNVILVGSYASNIILRKISKKLPVKFSDDEFLFARKVYKDSAQMLTMLYRSPWNPGKLIYLISGNNDEYISRNTDLHLNGGINISDNGLCEIMADFRINNKGIWTTDEERLRDFSALKKVYPAYKYYKYVVYSDTISRQYITGLNKKFVSEIKKVKLFFNGSLDVTKRACFIYDNFENKGLITGNTMLENTNISSGSVSMVINGWIRGDDFYSNALLLLRKKLGKPKSDFLERGLAMHFTTDWRRKGYRFWAALIAGSGCMPGLNELLSNSQLQYISPLIADPLAGTFVDYLIRKYGKKKFIRNYKNLPAFKSRIQSLESGWKEYLAKIILLNKNALNGYNESFDKNIPRFQKGFCFAHVGYDIYNGYISEEAKKSLDRIRRLGANSFSITPFTSMRNAASPRPLRFWEFAGAENDESLIYLTHIASLMHMTVMMKPQIYLGRNSWPGDIKMNNGKDWQRFFHYYLNWISHYAMISEIYRIPIICIGNELEGATVGHEKQWLKMISAIKKLYGGKITYGANWNYEFENIKFWNACDYMGISEYFPLSNKDNPTDGELYTGAETVLKKINSVRKKYGKPLIFTEVGFRSSGRPWKTAGEKSGRDSTNLINQSRCYKALLKASYGKNWLAGMYWWKWPSYLSYGRNGENSMYVPNSKPAQNVVKVWYSKKWN